MASLMHWHRKFSTGLRNSGFTAYSFEEEENISVPKGGSLYQTAVLFHYSEIQNLFAFRSMPNLAGRG